MCAAVSTSRRRDLVIHPSARIARPTSTGFLNSTLIRAVRPQLSSPTSDQAITSSRIVHRIPPWAMPSQPSKRRSSVSSVQQRRGSTWRTRPMPLVFSEPHAKQWCGATSKRGTPGMPTTRVPASDVKILHLPGLGHDEALARRDLLAHEHREDLVGERGVLRIDAQERARLRVHGRLPELVSVHLAEALEPLHGQVLDVELLDDPLALLLALRIARDLAGAHPVKRRLGDVQEAGVHYFGHMPIEERQQQRSDVGPIDVGVGHDDDPVVAQFRHVEALADASPERDDQWPHVLARKDLVETGLLDVQKLAAQWQDGLEAAVAALLGRAARRVALDDVQLAAGGVPFLAIGQLAGEGHAIECALADHEVARLAGRLAGSS